MDQQEVLALNQRSAMYRLTSRFFRTEITRECLDGLKAAGFPTDNPEENPLAEGFALIRKFIDEPREDPLTDLAVDYASAFLGAGKTKAAYPYESVYTSPERLVMQGAWEEVTRIFRAHGLACSDHRDIMEDHIAMELEFMAHLTDDALAARKAGNDAAYAASLKEQQSFLKNHLLNWVPSFAHEAREYIETDFYRGAVDVTEKFLAMDAYMLNDLLASAGITPEAEPEKAKAPCKACCSKAAPQAAAAQPQAQA